MEKATMWETQTQEGGRDALQRKEDVSSTPNKKDKPRADFTEHERLPVRNKGSKTSQT